MSEALSARPGLGSVLVVDDDIAYLDFMRTLLGGEGYDVRLAASLPDLATALRPTPPGLVICDIRMPGAPPFATLDRLAADPRTAAIPVLVCSGAVAELDAARGRWPHGRVSVLRKPFDIDELLVAVAASLSPV